MDNSNGLHNKNKQYKIEPIIAVDSGLGNSQTEVKQKFEIELPTDTPKSLKMIPPAGVGLKI